MAAFALTDVDILVGGLDQSCFANKATVKVEAGEARTTTFCSNGWESRIPTLKGVQVEVEGPQDLTAAVNLGATVGPDEQYLVTLGSAYTISVVPLGGTEGNTAYFTDAMLTEYTPIEGAVGDLGSHMARFAGRNPLVRGTLASLQTVSASGNGAGYQLGAVSATQRIWVAAHVLALAGTSPTVQIIVESDDNSGFTSPTTRVSPSAITTRAGVFASALGAITDNWWRARWVVSGTSPSIQLRVMLGIA